jgi:3'-5' exoribonuclease
VFVKEIKDGDRLDQIFLVKKFEIKSARNGKNYADLLLSDQSGDIPAKLWDITQAEPQDLSAGDFALIRASAEKYNGTVQLIASSVKRPIRRKKNCKN